MWDFSGDEFVFFWVVAAVAVVGTVRSALVLFRTPPIRSGSGPKLALVATVVACLVGLYVVLRRWSDPVSVAGHLDYVTLFMLGGVAWLFAAARLGFPL